MKIVLSNLFAPANETISCSNIPWRWPPCQTRNRAIMRKCNIFEMLPNWLSITKIMVLTYKTIEYLLKRSSANLVKFFIGNRSSTEQWTGVLSTITQDVFFRFARGLGGVHFRAGSLIKPFDSKRSSRLRQIISLRTPLGCLQFHSLQTSWEMKRLLLSGCDSIIRLTVAIFCLVTDRLRYVMTDSIPDTINHQALERKIFLKKICG